MLSGDRDVLKKYYPHLVGYIAPIISPMLVHAKMLRQSLGEDIFVVFAGPCIGKIAEADQVHSEVNAVITFEQLREWLGEAQCTDAAPILAPKSMGMRVTSRLRVEF